MAYINGKEVLFSLNMASEGSNAPFGEIEALAVEVDSIENPTEESATIAKYNNNFYILTEV